MKKVNKLLFVMIPIFLFIAIWALGELRFYGNDEILIMDVLSGRMTGEPYACTSYFHIFLGFIISRLYKIAYFPWFPAFIIISTLLGEMCIYDGMYTFLKSKANIFIKIVVGIINLYLSIFTISMPTYTTAATFMGVAAIYLLYKNKFALSVSSLLLATAIRHQSGFVACAFWVAMLVIMAYKQESNIIKLVKKVFLRVLMVALAVLAVYASDEFIKAKIEPEGYADFRNGQTLNFDFPKSEEFIINQDKILKSIGWNNELYSLNAYHYFSMDDRISAESYKTLKRYVSGVFGSGIIKYINNNIIKIPSMLLVFIMIFTLSFYHLYTLIRGKSSHFVLFLLVYIFMIGLLLYLCIMQRALMRSVLSIVLPMLMITLLDFEYLYIKPVKRETIYFDIAALALSLLLFITGRFLILTLLVLAFSFFRFKNKYIMSAVTIMLVISLSVLCVTVGKAQYRFAKFVDEISVNKEKIESYAQKHRENIYIYGADFFLDNRINTTSTSTYNVFAYGGTQVHSRVHEIQMEKAGLKYYNTRALYENNVYFVDLVSNPADVRLMNELLKSKGKDDVLQLYDRIDNSDIGIYKLQN